MQFHSLTVVGCFLCLAGGFASVAQAATVDYQRQIKVVFQSRCLACHGALKQEGDLRLDTAAAAIRGGASGPAIHPARPQESLLLERVTTTDPAERMPPEGEPLTAEQIAALRTWIAEGAAAPAEEKGEADPREHWAFQTPQRPPVPVVRDSLWNQNPIDAFIEAERERIGLPHQPAADKRLWLRRVTLDLVGLPPTLEDQAAFLADTSAQAEERVVDRLLNSPQYGERWGRHWMDVWRYSDWWGLGAEVRNSQKHIWHWRDWIVESLNDDKGYDQMLREMLAADELYPQDLSRLRATGFLARQYFKFNRTSWLDETIEHTSKSMLGLTLNCGKCHDHKYDPFSQAEYYRLRAIFEPYQVRTEIVAGEPDVEKNGIPRAFDCNLDAPTYLHVRGDDRNPDKSRTIPPAVPGLVSQVSWKVEPVTLPAEAYLPGLRTYVLKDLLHSAEAKLAAAVRELAAARESWEQSLGGEHERVSLAVAEAAHRAAELAPATLRARHAADEAYGSQQEQEVRTARARDAAKLERDLAAATAQEAAARAELEYLRAPFNQKAATRQKWEAAQKGVETAREAVAQSSDQYTPLPGALKTLESNLETEDSRRKPFPTTSTGRRAAFARWLTDPQHPLPARVAVNHIWARHFGRPLVATVFDFGRKGSPPTHPALLDWLAVELRENHWSMKHLHRLMVLSRTYRQSSSSRGYPEAALQRDPENRFYWRAQPQRMEAQLIRDSLLHLAGELDLTRGGPSIPVNQTESRRRSLYFVHSHNEHQKFLSMFDDAGVLECYRRAESIVPQQALALENSPLAREVAEKLSRRLATIASGNEDEFIRQAFLTILATEPTAEELQVARDGVRRWAEAALRQGRGEPQPRARVGLVSALLNHNDFVTIR